MKNNGYPEDWKIDPANIDVSNLLLDKADNRVAIPDKNTIFSDIQNSEFKLGWKDSDWDKEVFLYSTCTESRMCQIIAHYAMSIWPQHLDNHRIVRTVLNAGVPGSVYRSHADDVDMSKNTKTVLYMANPTWEHGWGGEFKFYDPYVRDLVGMLEYKPGRMIIFDGNIQHTAACIAYHASMWRFTVAQNYVPMG